MRGRISGLSSLSSYSETDFFFCLLVDLFFCLEIEPDFTISLSSLMETLLDNLLSFVDVSVAASAPPCSAFSASCLVSTSASVPSFSGLSFSGVSAVIVSS